MGKSKLKALRKNIPLDQVLSRTALRAALERRIREDFYSFLKMAFETVVPGETLHENWHLRAIIHVLERVSAGEIHRLVITIPPRHLKSIIVSVALPAFLLGHDPTLKIICVSYSGDLAAKHASDFRAVVNSDWYKRVFPEMRISPAKNTEFETMTTKRGSRLATSVGGTLTGRGGDVIILDDALNPKQARSDTQRLSAIEWYRTTLLTRTNSKIDGVIIHVAQRLHTDDLIGHVLEQGGFTHLNISAIAEQDERIPLGQGQYHRRKPGDLLDPVREPRHVLEKIKAEMGTTEFSSQYQQEPIPREGNFIKRDWLKYYEAQPSFIGGIDRWVISWDTAMKASGASDYSVATIWLIQKHQYYLIDLVRGRFDFPQLKQRAISLKEQYPHSTILVEDKASGTSLIQELRRTQIPVIAINPDGDKEGRLYSCQPEFESGAVLFPAQASWVPELIDELLGFPGTRHDDQVDSLTQAIRWNKRQPPPMTFHPIFFVSVPRNIPGQ